MEVKRFAHEFGMEILFLNPEINNLDINFWLKKTLVVSYPRDIIT